MRLSKPLLTLLAGSLAAAAAAAQQAETPEEAVPQLGLSGLQDMIGQLEDAPAPAPEAELPPPAPAPEAEVPPPEPAPSPVPPPVRASAAAPSPPPLPLTRAEVAALDAAAERGRLLFAIARAGYIATQDMLSRISDPDGVGIAGWIAEPEGNAMAVTFYADADAEDGPASVYRARVLGGRVVSRDVFLSGDRPRLGPIQARMAAARRATDGLAHRPCSDQPFNVFVIAPAGAAAPVDVYQVTAPAQSGRFPLGGHFKSTVAADGTLESRDFTNACVDLEVSGPPAGEQPRPLAVTHLLDPLPTEIHAFLSLWTGRPLVVVAGDPQRLFAVTGERIAEMRE